jgi:hypothetical protein
MRWKSVLAVGALVPLGSGCNLFYYAGHNLVNEPITRLDEHRLSGRLMAESRETWACVCRQFPKRTFTPEFADGFTDGYADLLENGGDPHVPTVPPLRYRRSNYLTPAGHALTRDYMVAYQYGGEVAVATGQRQFLTVPVALPNLPAAAPLNVTQFPAPPAGSLDPLGSVPAPTPPVTPAPPASDALPSPRPLDPPAAPKAPPAAALPLPVPVPAQPAPVPPPPADPALKPAAGEEAAPPRLDFPDLGLPAFDPGVPALPPTGVIPPTHRPPASLPPAPQPGRDPS